MGLVYHIMFQKAYTPLNGWVSHINALWSSLQGISVLMIIDLVNLARVGAHDFHVQGGTQSLQMMPRKMLLSFIFGSLWLLEIETRNPIALHSSTFSQIVKWLT